MAISEKPQLSVTLITLNEEAHIARAIESVQWADEILVVDSGSTDRTQEIVKHLGVRFLHHPWDGYGQQKNYAHSQVNGEWVLNLDADEVVSPELAKEIQDALKHSERVDGFSFPRKTYYLKRWIRYGGWFPNRLVRLSRKDKSFWTEPPVHEELKVQGRIQELKTPLDHYGFSSIEEQVLTNTKFAKLGAERLRKKGVKPSILKLLFKPYGKFMETYFLKKGFLDGLPGLIISFNAAYSMFLKYAYLLEPRLQRDPK